MDGYNQGLCDEKHKNVDDILDDHEKMLNRHDKDISELKSTNKGFEVKISDLCDEIKSLIATIKWGVGIFATVCSIVVGYFASH